MTEWVKQNPGYTFLIIFFGYVTLESCVDKIFGNKKDKEKE